MLWLILLLLVFMLFLVSGVTILPHRQAVNLGQVRATGLLSGTRVHRSLFSCWQSVDVRAIVGDISEKSIVNQIDDVKSEAIETLIFAQRSFKIYD